MGKHILNVKEGKDTFFVYLQDFKKFIDIDQVVYYSLRRKKNDTCIITFYDKKKKRLSPYGQK